MPTTSPALQFLAERINYERAQSMPCSEAAFKLDRMRELLRRLGDPQGRVPIIHVAGTKGKGSTAAMIAAVLSAAGFRTGLFTSPHLERVEERIALDGRPCSEQELAELIELIRPAVVAMDREAQSAATPDGQLGPTYFELLTAAALCHFVRAGANAVVLEVGLGGRLDSTNVCTPCVSIITSISFDHVKQLGPTLAAIAAEKAGIIKPGVPVVSGVTDDEPRAVVRKVARQHGCRLLELGVDFDFDYRPPQHLERGPSPARVDFIKPRPVVAPEVIAPEVVAPEVVAPEVVAPEVIAPEVIAPGGATTGRGFMLNLLGRHQAANAALALATVDELRRNGWSIPEDAVHRGLAEVALPARVEVVARRPTVVLDAAHNAASIEALVEVLDESFSARRRWLIFATTQEKDLRGMLARLLGRFDRVIFTRYQDNPRSVPPEELLALARELRSSHPERSEGSRGSAAEILRFAQDDKRRQDDNCRAAIEIVPTPAEAWDTICRLADPDDLICITGSFFLAAEMRRLLAARQH